MTHVRAVIYLRQSRDRAGDELAIKRQREDCERLCRERKWTVAEVVPENDTSASSDKPRPQFARVLSMVDAGEVDVVVCWHVDRLVRRLADLEDVITRCEKAGVKLATVSGDLDLSTDAGRLVGRILASVARGEVERKSARQRRAQRQAAEAGKPVKWSHRPFGYEVDKTTKMPSEAAAVVSAADQILSGGTLLSIARQWTVAGHTPPQGAARWTTASVRNVLRNPRIAGLSTYDGEIVGRGKWDALVGEETWRAVRAVLDDPSRGNRRRGVRTLLGGVARCRCGAPMFGGRNTRGDPAYRCRDMSGQSFTRGPHVTRTAAPINGYIRDLVVERLSRPDAVDLLTDPARPDVDALRAEANTLRARLDQHADDYADGVLDRRQYQRQRERTEAKLADVEARMADAGRESVLGPLVRVGDVRAAWDALDLDRQRAVVQTLMSVTLHSPGRGARSFAPGTVDVAWTGGRA
jgi:DNA invertase Pin-like site-specific DNA recombinase